ncbi:MAG: hypothetical protein N2485_01330 [bacterium]|nr:hypothetical protein [bacterium]
MDNLTSETLYYILKDINAFISNIKEGLKNSENIEIRNTIEEMENLFSNLIDAVENQDNTNIYKYLLKLKSLELKILINEAKNNPLYLFWEELLKNIKSKKITNEELKEFYETEMSKLFMNAEIVVNIITLEDDEFFKNFLDVIFGEAFRNYYNALEKIKEFILKQDYSILENILDNILVSSFFFVQIYKIIPEEYSKNLEDIIKGE